MLNVETLYIICSILQIMMIPFCIFWNRLPSYSAPLISVAGFASVVKVFLPVAGNQSLLTIVAALVGIVLIFAGVYKVKLS